MRRNIDSFGCLLLFTLLVGGNAAMLRAQAPPTKDPFGESAPANVPMAVLPARANAEAANLPSPVREIFIPFKDLDVVLDQQIRRVFLTRAEYQELLTKAKKSPEELAPHPGAIVAADYQVTVEDGRARITGTLQVEGMSPDLHALELPLVGVGLRSATLDGRGASLLRDPDGKTRLFAQGVGKHVLLLDMTAPLTLTAALQTMNLQLPTPPATKLHLSVPGNVEMRSGAEVIDRVVDDEAGVTRFQLLPARGPMTIVMTLNNRTLQKDRVVVARSVIVDEITQGYERLHVTASMGILYGATDRFRFAIPAEFDVTGVTSPLLARWSVEANDDGKVVEVLLREPTTETVLINLTAVRTPPRFEDWTIPKFEPLEVAGQVAVLGLLIEDRLKVKSLATEDLIPIDTTVLSSSLPASIFQAEPGAPLIRAVAAYYAPQAKYSLSAEFERPESRLRATTNLLLQLSDTKQEVRGGFALLPVAEKIFECDFTAPRDWQITSVTYGDGQPLAFERYDDADAGSRIHVRLPQGVPPGQTYSIYFHAVRAPAEWLGNWQRTELTFPTFAIVGAAHDEGAIAVQTRDDLVARPEKLVGLTPLDENKIGEFGFKDVSVNLAYRYDNPPYEALLNIERVEPRLTARTFSFLQIFPDHVRCHYEIAFEVTEARTRRLTFSLPAGTPAEIAVRGLDNLGIKETSSEVVQGQRRWTVRLAEPQATAARIAIDFEQRETTTADRVDLPLVRAEGVMYQTGVVAVEGNSELDVQILEGHPRKVDIGELADAEYQPGKRLLGAFGFTGDEVAVSIKVERHDSYGLPTAIVERSELVTRISGGGLSQTAARFLLRTKATILSVQLPPGSALWSIYLDGQATKPQRDKDSLLVNLPARSEAALRDLQIVYETPTRMLGLWANNTIPAPTLRPRSDDGQAAREIPVADLKWKVYLPSGHRLARAGGTVHTDELRDFGPSESRLWQVLYMAGGGVRSEAVVSVQDLGLGMQNHHDAKTRAVPKSGAALRFDNGHVAGNPYEADDRAEMPSDQPAATEESEAASDSEVLSRLEDPTARPKPAEEPAMEAPAVPAPSTTAPATPKVAPGPGPNDPHGGGKQAGKGKLAMDWALEGVSSLKIDLNEGVSGVNFQSLGVDPRLELTIVDENRLDGLAWGLALLVAVWGLLLTNRPTGRKIRFLVSVWLATLLLPLLTPWGAEFGRAFDRVFIAACLVALYYLLVGAWRSIRWPRATSPVAATLALIVAAVLATPAFAAEPETKTRDGKSIVVQVVESAPPVKVPDDAIVVPYDADVADGLAKAEKILLPYERYVELWNLAHPMQKVEDRPALIPYALAGAEFSATLGAEDYLTITGHIDVDVFASGTVAIPLALEGGVLSNATLGGKPARLQVIEVAAPAPPQPTEQAAQQAKAAPNPAPPGQQSLVVLHIAGQGRQRLEIEARFRLTRQGGWRVVQGRLPSAPASSLTLDVPQAETDVRLVGVADRGSRETKADHEKIATTLAADGSFQLQWRPKITEAQVDRSLTVESDARLDVEDDGLRLEWQLTLAFPRAQRELFTVQIPADYLVEKVTGGNIRGWQLRGEDDARRLEVTLLKPARDGEKFAVLLSRRGPIGQEDETTFDAPVISVDGAMLHHGKLGIRRSPLLDVRTIEDAGVSRADADAAREPAADNLESPLGLRPYRAYRFVTTPFTVKLAASPVPSKTAAQVQSLLRIAERQRTFESRIFLDVQGRPVYRVRVELPEGLQLADVIAPGVYEWSVATEDAKQLLSVYLTQGQQQRFSLVLRGQLGTRGVVEQVALPRIAVLDVVRQQGDLVVQADPALEVSAVDLKNCENVLLGRADSWLRQEQRALARLAIGYTKPDHSGAIRIGARQPRVECLAVANVRITERAFEETILLDYTVQYAGIREVSFLLPAWMKDARIETPLLRQKTITAVGKDQVRVHIQLQDEVMGQLRVIVNNDRLVNTDSYQAPIPVIEAVAAQRRYVVLESAGRDEVIIDRNPGLELLDRQQQEWTTLAQLLGPNITQAFIVRDATGATLAMHTKDRAAVETVGARIGFAQAVISVDSYGAYRARQEYRVDNSTEQFLEIELPADAELWTVLVAGEAVKPTAVANAADRVRIPLVKTAVGDQDFAVEIKYGGRLPELGWGGQVAFPLVRTKGINVEQSQVRLLLPRTHRWFNFGGTMGRVEDQAELAAGYLSYQTTQIKQLSEALNSSNEYANVRARNNLKILGTQLEGLATYNARNSSNRELAREQAASLEALRLANEQAVQQVEQQNKTDINDNRGRLNSFYFDQRAQRSKNVVNDLGGNFEAPTATQPPSSGEYGFNKKWFKSNQLDNAADGTEEGEKKPAAKQPQSRFVPQQEVAAPAGKPIAQPGQPAAAQLAQGQDQGQLKTKDDNDRQSTESLEKRSGSERSRQQRLQRYEQKLQMQNDGQSAQVLSDEQLSTGKDKESYGRRMPAKTPGDVAPNAANTAADSPQPRGDKVEGVTVNQAGTTISGLAPAAPPVPTGMASLDVELPQRGVEYLFSTPRGDVQLTATAVADSLTQRLTLLAAVLALAVVVGLVVRFVRRRGLDHVVNRPIAALLILVGFVSLCTGVFPILGVALIVLALVQLVRLSRFGRMALLARQQ